MSGVPDVQQSLVDLLSASAAFDGVLVRFAAPLELPNQRERVYVIDEENYRLGGGEQWRDESFTARLIVEVFDPGDNPKRASDRRWELIDAIDAVLTAEDLYGYANQGGSLAVSSVLVAVDDKNYVARSVVSIGIGNEV